MKADPRAGTHFDSGGPLATESCGAEAMRELGRGFRVPTERELSRVVGPAIYRGLSFRQKRLLRFMVLAVRAAEALRTVTPWGQREAAAAALAGRLGRLYGTRCTAKSLRRWRLTLRRRGVVGLVDMRGRPPRETAADAELLSRFAEALGRGADPAKTHARILRWADREGRPWPRSFVALEKLLAARDRACQRRARRTTEPRPNYLRGSTLT